MCNGIFLSAMFYGCDSPKFDHISYPDRKFVDLDCNADCACGQQTFQPVCAPDGKTNYFSPCFAGCSASNTFDNNQTKLTVSISKNISLYFHSNLIKFCPPLK